MNRDPIEEQGGLNLYAFVGNDGVNWLDLLGLALSPCGCDSDTGQEHYVEVDAAGVECCGKVIEIVILSWRSLGNLGDSDLGHVELYFPEKSDGKTQHHGTFYGERHGLNEQVEADYPESKEYLLFPETLSKMRNSYKDIVDHHNYDFRNFFGKRSCVGMASDILESGGVADFPMYAGPCAPPGGIAKATERIHDVLVDEGVPEGLAGKSALGGN